MMLLKFRSFTTIFLKSFNYIRYSVPKTCKKHEKTRWFLSSKNVFSFCLCIINIMRKSIFFDGPHIWFFMLYRRAMADWWSILEASLEHSEHGFSRCTVEQLLIGGQILRRVCSILSTVFHAVPSSNCRFVNEFGSEFAAF